MYIFNKATAHYLRKLTRLAFYPLIVGLAKVIPFVDRVYEFIAKEDNIYLAVLHSLSTSLMGTVITTVFMLHYFNVHQKLFNCFYSLICCRRKSSLYQEAIEDIIQQGVEGGTEFAALADFEDEDSHAMMMTGEDDDDDYMFEATAASNAASNLLRSNNNNNNNYRSSTLQQTPVSPEANGTNNNYNNNSNTNHYYNTNLPSPTATSTTSSSYNNMYEVSTPPSSPALQAARLESKRFS